MAWLLLARHADFIAAGVMPLTGCWIASFPLLGDRVLDCLFPFVGRLYVKEEDRVLCREESCLQGAPSNDTYS